MNTVIVLFSLYSVLLVFVISQQEDTIRKLQRELRRTRDELIECRHIINWRL